MVASLFLSRLLGLLRDTVMAKQFGIQFDTDCYRLAVTIPDTIFFLIAGTYSPFTLGPMRGVLGWTIFALIWSLAVIGVIFKLCTGLRWKKLSLVLYLGMGWLILLAFRQFVHAVPTQTVIWLLAGGIAYTSGVVFFGNERLRYSHFVWHLFVLAGTACHFCAIFSCAA